MEFENQLCQTFTDVVSSGTVLGGDTTLSSILWGSAVPGAWSIILGTQAAANSNGQTVPNCESVGQFFLAQANVETRDSAFWLTEGGGTEAIPFALFCSLYASFDSCQSVLAVTATTPGVGVTLSGQFVVPAALFGESQTITISAVGTDLYTCSGASGPPTATDCQQLGIDANSNLNAIAQANPLTGGICFSGNRATGVETWTGCDPSASSTVYTTTYSVGGQRGRSPFSGVVLTGTGNIPAPFTVSTGQTVAVTWSLSFQ
jgi:hypothetical protein